MAAILTALLPSITIPSVGTFAPGLTMKISPRFTSEAGTSTSVLPRRTIAVSGISDSKALRLCCALVSENSSRPSEIEKRMVSMAASSNLPRAIAPKVAIVMSVPTPIFSFRNFLILAGMNVQPAIAVASRARLILIYSALPVRSRTNATTHNTAASPASCNSRTCQNFITAFDSLSAWLSSWSQHSALTIAPKYRTVSDCLIGLF